MQAAVCGGEGGVIKRRHRSVMIGVPDENSSAKNLPGCTADHIGVLLVLIKNKRRRVYGGRRKQNTKEPSDVFLRVRLKGMCGPKMFSLPGKEIVSNWPKQQRVFIQVSVSPVCFADTCSGQIVFLKR